MNPISTQRIQSLDVLKGLVMIVMALDHTRDYFHSAAFLFDPTDPENTTSAIYFTRWITHYCAPAFSLLAGISAFLVGRRKSKMELSGFLFKRGIWLMFIELTVVNFSWFFDIHFSFFGMMVIWSLGISMILLAALIHLPRRAILVFSLAMIFGHNLLDSIHFDGNILWAIIHEMQSFQYGDVKVMVAYPIIPWVGVMSLGYYVGAYYNKEVNPKTRQKIFTRIGLAGIVLFAVFRLINQYGNLYPWVNYDSLLMNAFAFFNPAKYPPSLTYLLMTLGPIFVILGNSEHWKGKWVDYFSVYGKVPFFYYIVHIYVIHTLALIFAQVTGFGWKSMVFTEWVTTSSALKGYGVDLWVVYVIWVGIVLFLYPFCKKFSIYKLAHKEKWWLSYF